eukprot:gene50306-67367_t
MFARFSKFSARPILKAAQRTFSAGHGNAKSEMEQWSKLSMGMIALSTVVAIYNVAFGTHEHGNTGLPYQKIRSKPYPWSCPDCNLLDYPCWDECKGTAE